MRPVQQAFSAMTNLLGLDRQQQQEPSAFPGSAQPNPLAGGVGSWMGYNMGPQQHQHLLQVG